MRRLLGWLFLITFGVGTIWVAISFLIYLPIDQAKVHPTVARLDHIEAVRSNSFGDHPGSETDFNDRGLSCRTGTTWMNLQTPQGPSFFRIRVEEHRITLLSFWAQDFHGSEIVNPEYPDTQRRISRLLERHPKCHPSIVMRISKDPFAITRSAVRYYLGQAVSEMRIP